MSTSDFARGVFETALTSKYEAYGERLRGLAAHMHSHTTLGIHQHCNRRFGHFARPFPRGLGRGEGNGDTVVTFLEPADNATLDVAAEILGLPAASLPGNTRSEMSLPVHFGGMGVGDLVALADAAHAGAAGLAVGSATR
jgi:L-alanine-DL-glutamate epimerase-like enolase superfamily enzyme